MVIWSDSCRTVILAELTCPAEEGITEAKIRKHARYGDLTKKIEDPSRRYPWKAYCFTIESGARGFVANSLPRFLKRIGFKSAVARYVCQDVSEVTARCSYGIWLARGSKS